MFSVWSDHTIWNLVPTWHHVELLPYYWLCSLCCIYISVHCFVTTDLYFLIPFTFLTESHKPPPIRWLLICSESASVLLTFFRFHIEVKSYAICLSLTYFTFLNTSKSIHVVTNGKISFFLWLIIFHWIYVLPLLSPVVYEWTLRLLSISWLM